MGYYTNYSLSIDVSNEIFKKIEDYVFDGCLSKELVYLFEHKCEYYNSKWYENEKDMKSLSTTYPDVLFTLEGEGEEGGDLWKKYFLGGKMQVAEAKITFDKFDPKKLK